MAPTPTVVAIVVVVAAVELVVVATRIAVVWVVEARATTVVVPTIVAVTTVVVAIIAVRTVATVVAVVIPITIIVAVRAVATTIISFRTIGFVEAVAYAVLKRIVVTALRWCGGAVARTTLSRAHILLTHTLIGVVAGIVALWSGVSLCRTRGYAPSLHIIVAAWLSSLSFS